MKKVNLMSISVSTGTYREFVHAILNLAETGRSHYTCVANVHMLVEAHRSGSFADIVRDANVITPDGKPLAWALRLLYGIRQDRVSGMDLLPDLLNAAATKKLPVFFYGATEEMLEETKTFLLKTYPDLTVAGFYSPPFRKLSHEEEEAIIEKVNTSGASLVFVVLGCPKQERWMASMKGRIKAVTVGVGGALPVMIGRQDRAPTWMQNAGLEWFFRLCQEPKRLIRRYAITNSWFLYLLTKEFFRIKFSND